MKLILASTSPYRRAQLERLGVPFEARAPLCDEQALKKQFVQLTPKELAEALAEAKAASLCSTVPDATLIGGDQLACLNGTILDKPGTHARALEQLAQLSGHTHELITAIAVWSAGRWIKHTDVTKLGMRHLSAEQIERYLRADQPYDCAGSFKLEQRGMALFEKIESEDHSAVTGLPLLALSRILIELGFPLP